jgi:hypothetical protein
VPHSLFKYFTERKWADAFIGGAVLFRSLAYFRDCEDQNVRSDRNEGIAIFRPTDGLLIHNQTQGTTFRWPDTAFESEANEKEIFVFCASRTLSDELSRRFEAAVCVEIKNISSFCARIQRRLPAAAKFYSGPVEYYDQGEGPGARWALPDRIARSKSPSYQWQDEYRFVFSLTDALNFENAAYRLVKGSNPKHGDQKSAEHPQHLVKVRTLRDICQLHAPRVK